QRRTAAFQDEALDRLANDLLGRQAEQPLRTGIAAGQYAVATIGDDAVANVPDDALGLLHGLLQGSDHLVVLFRDLPHLGEGLHLYLALELPVALVFSHGIEQLDQLGPGTVLADVQTD